MKICCCNVQHHLATLFEDPSPDPAPRTHTKPHKKKTKKGEKRLSGLKYKINKKK